MSFLQCRIDFKVRFMAYLKTNNGRCHSGIFNSLEHSSGNTFSSHWIPLLNIQISMQTLQQNSDLNLEMERAVEQLSQLFI